MPTQRALDLHSLTINDEIDTWDDWKIVTLKKPVFNEPELKYEYAEVPGRSGPLDMTEVLTGYPLYDNRKGTLQFFLYDDSVKALTKLNIIRNYLHGKKHKIILNDEPEYYYIGRLMMHESHPTTEGEYAVFDLEYNLEPYKYELTASNEDWLWDPFNFETGVIREYKDIMIDFNADIPVTVNVVGSPKPTVPKIRIKENMLIGGDFDNAYLTLTVNGKTYNLWKIGAPISGSIIVFPDIVLFDDEYEFTFNYVGVQSAETLYANISIEFQGGCL